MKRKFVLMLLLFVLFICAIQPVNHPQAEIENELINARLYLPDTQTGYYMATRFDWSGIIESLEFNGHEYFGQWFDTYSPTIHDAIMGPVEEFAPLGYDEAGPGGNFVKIGVGVLQKPPSDSIYGRFSLYPIEDHGNWKINQESDQVTFIQELEHEYYSYEYTKTVRLISDRPELELVHILKNNGKRTIETNVYNHNFFVMDNKPTGSGFVVTFPFKLTVDPERIGEIAEIENNRIGFKRDLVKGETIRLGSVTGFSNNPEDLDIKVENHKTGAGVRITGDQPLSRLIFWASLKTLCPETYIEVKIEPGQEFSWTFHYEFYTFDVQK